MRSFKTDVIWVYMRHAAQSFRLMVDFALVSDELCEPQLNIFFATYSSTAPRLSLLSETPAGERFGYAFTLRLTFHDRLANNHLHLPVGWHLDIRISATCLRNIFEKIVDRHKQRRCTMREYN